MTHRTFPQFAFLFLATLLTACSITPHQPTILSDKDIYDSNFQTAIIKLNSDQHRYDEKNRLLWILHQCSLHHYNRDYVNSNKYCQQAETLSERLSVDSITENLVAMLSNENAFSYPGLPFERTLLYPIGMISYLGIDRPSEALVDARKLDLFVGESGNSQEEAFARYLSALIYESEGETDSALIDYRRSFQIYSKIKEYSDSPLLKRLGSDLRRNLESSGMENELEKLEMQFDIERDDDPFFQNNGEIVFIFESGFAPYRATEYIRAPESGEIKAVGLYKSRPPLIHHVRAKKIGDKTVSETETVYDSDIATRHWQNHNSSTLFHQQAITPILAANFEKYGSSNFDIDSIDEQERAEVRSWSTLPGKISILRMSLPEGKHDIALKFFSYYGEEIYRQVQKDIMIKRGKRTFVNLKLP